MTGHFETYRAIIAQEPCLPDLFRRVLGKLTAMDAPVRVLNFARWNMDTLDRCIAEECVEDLMAWEETFRNFLVSNRERETSKLYCVMMARLNQLLFAHNMEAFANLSV